MRELSRPSAAHGVVPVGRIFHGHLQPVHHPLASGEEKPQLWDEPDPGWHAVLQQCHARHVFAAGISQRYEVALGADLLYPRVPVELVSNRGLPSHGRHASGNTETVKKSGFPKRGIYLAHERERAETGFDARGHSRNPADLTQEWQVGRMQKSAFDQPSVVVDMEVKGPRTNQRVRQLVIGHAAIAPRSETETGIVIVDLCAVGDDAVAALVGHN